MQVITVAGENAGAMTGKGTNTYLIPGARPTLIDAAEDSPAYIDRIAEAPGCTRSSASAMRSM